MAKKPNFEKKGFTKATDEDRHPIHEWTKGDAIWGLLVDKREVSTEKGDNIIYAVELDKECKEFLKTKEDVLSFWGSEILNTRLKNCEPGQEIVAIEYMGKKKGKKFSYHHFEVFHKPAEIDSDIKEALGDAIE